MCRIVEEYANSRKEEGKIEGRIEGKVEAVENMIADGFELDAALKLVKLDKETYSNCRKRAQ